MTRPAYRRSVPNINAKLRNLPQLTRAAIRAFNGYNEPPRYFSYGGRNVRLGVDDNGKPILVPVSVDVLRNGLAEAANWYSGRDANRYPDMPPLDLVRNVLADPNFRLPRVRRIVPAPVLLPGGTLLPTPGYDAASGMFYLPSEDLRVSLDLLGMPTEPTREEAQYALNQLLEILQDFPFDSVASRANTLALLFLPYLMTYIDAPTPFHLIDKPEPGSGATLLLMASLTPYLGVSPSMTTMPEDEGEVRRTLTALLRSGGSVVCLDNLPELVKSRTLSSILTTGKYQDRMVGTSITADMDVECLWAGTGNNVCLTKENARRVSKIRLDARTARPDLRTDFKHPDLLRHVLGHRCELVYYCLTLIQYWANKGCPLGKQRLGGFERWSAVMGGLLETLGIEGFLANREDVMDSAVNDSDKWATFVQCWWQILEGRVVTSQELHRALPLDAHSAPTPHALGLIVSQLRDREVGGYVVRKPSSASNKAHWQLEKVTDQAVAGSSPVAASAALPLPEATVPLQPPDLVCPTAPGNTARRSSMAVPAKIGAAQRQGKKGRTPKISPKLTPAEDIAPEEPEARGEPDLDEFSVDSGSGAQGPDEADLSAEEMFILNYIDEQNSSLSAKDREDALAAMLMYEIESETCTGRAPDLRPGDTALEGGQQ